MIPIRSSLQGVCLNMCVCVCPCLPVCLCMCGATGKWRKGFRLRWWFTKKNLHGVPPKGLRDKTDRRRGGSAKEGLLRESRNDCSASLPTEISGSHFLKSHFLLQYYKIFFVSTRERREMAERFHRSLPLLLRATSVSRRIIVYPLVCILQNYID